MNREEATKRYIEIMKDQGANHFNNPELDMLMPLVDLERLEEKLGETIPDWNFKNFSIQKTGPDIIRDIAFEIKTALFHPCKNPTCDMWITGNVAYCCSSCEMGHVLGQNIAHDRLCSDYKHSQIKAWGSHLPPAKQIKTSKS
mgnify:CR=1 FL=1